MTDLSLVDLEDLRRVAAGAVVGASTGRRRQVVALGTAAAETAFPIASLSKTVTAVAAVRAADRAGVALGTPVLAVLPELRDDWRADERLTVAQVLSQTSGLSSTVTADDVRELGDDDSCVLEAARLVVRAGSARPPGERWEYYNGNYFLAGAIVAALAGTSFEDAAADLVLRPWGLTATAFRPASAYPRGRRPSGGLCSTAGDLLGLGERLLDDAELLARLSEVRTPAEDPVRYGLGWAVGPSGQLYLNGRLPEHRAALMIVPAQGLVAVTLAESADALPAQARILSELQRAASGDDLATAIDAFAA